MGKTVSGKSMWGMLVFLGIGLGLIIYGGMLLSGGSEDSVKPASGEAREVLTGESVSEAEREAKVREAQAALRKLIEKAQGNLEQRNQSILAAFLEKVRGNMTAQSEVVRAGIPGVLEQFGGFRFCMKLACKYAKDALCEDSHDAEEAVQTVLNDAYLMPMTQMQAKATTDLAALERELKLSLATYEQEVAEAVTLSALPAQELSSIETVLKSYAKVQDMALREATGTAFLVAGAAVDMVFLKGALLSMKTVFQFVVGKLTASASGAAIAAAADGPLPIGDMIGTVFFVGGTIWTAKDIYDLKKDLPEKMTRELTEAVDAHQSELLTRAENTARDWCRQIEETTQGQSRQLYASLNH